MDPAIRASPYEPGLYFVSPEPGTTLQSIGTTEWKVGKRYKLEKVLGYGSFSCVCRAVDTFSGEYVAIKRIGDVLHSADQAKRALREVSILRRTSHPNLIGLRDCFLRPSSTGQCRLVNSKLVHSSLDLYIAMEYADGGDLFHIRGQLAPEEVTSIMWQLLQAVKYLHSLHLWHRDIKTQNAFIHWDRGVRVVKLGDFGSARSALLFDVDDTKLIKDTTLPTSKRSTATLPHDAESPRKKLIISKASKSFKDMEAAMHSDDLYAHQVVGIGTGESTQCAATTLMTPDKGFRAPLTRVVATPCYRAPEVVMSRGGYTSALDMWGVGCIFGEVLQRIAYVGSAATPNLRIAPLFALRFMPKTPQDGETFGHPGCMGTRHELEALFDVVGTPSWRDAAAVEMEEWRRYLEKLPGKAPTLYRRFKHAGEVAIHLLGRFLDFDPSGRATCEEALAHEFFAGLREELSDIIDAVKDRDDASIIQMEMSRKLSFDCGSLDADDNRSHYPNSTHHCMRSASSTALLAEEAYPGRALAILEEELERISGSGPSLTTLDPASPEGLVLRELLEAECEGAAVEAAARRNGSSKAHPAYKTSNVALEKLIETLSGQKSRLVDHVREDILPSNTGAGGDHGQERLRNVADNTQGSQLDPRKFLGSKRHGEWTAVSGVTYQAPGPRWGVTSTPPGLDAGDPRAHAIIKQQQGR